MKFRIFTFFSAILLSITGCQNSALENVRKLTYPPDFNYISQKNLTDTMQTFALYTSLLDNSLRDTAAVTAEQRLSAINLLSKMEKLSLRLGSETLSSNHNIVSFNIGTFRQSIIHARKGLQETPPNYYRAGKLSGYCINCHSLRE